jgi:putative RecB family exonuclease
MTAACSTEAGPSVIGSLSPSRAADFKACPLLYRFRAIDRLAEAPSRIATRGTVVHAVLERLYDLPAGARTVTAAQELVAPAWTDLAARIPELAELFADDDGEQLAGWLESARDLVAGYFTLEDPNRLEPAAREELVEVIVDGLRLRGYVDRLDVSTAGDIRIVDYKTGSTPREAFQAKALFQMKFYALVLWRVRGVLPRQLKLIYLADRDTLTYSPGEDELGRFESTLKAIWAAIARATAAREFRPSPGPLCEWCRHQERCPAFGGTPPPFPAAVETDLGSGIDAPRSTGAPLVPAPAGLEPLRSADERPVDGERLHG